MAIWIIEFSAMNFQFFEQTNVVYREWISLLQDIQRLPLFILLNMKKREQKLLCAKKNTSTKRYVK